MTSTRNETEERARQFLFQYGPNVNIELVPAIMVLWSESESKRQPISETSEVCPVCHEPRRKASNGQWTHYTATSCKGETSGEGQ